MNKLYLLIFGLFFYGVLSAQIRPLTYFAQSTKKGTSYSRVGESIIQSGFINADTIADIAWATNYSFQVGYGRIEQGELYFDMQAVDYWNEPRNSQGQLVDIDSDSDMDFVVPVSLNNWPNIVHDVYYFENQADTINNYALDLSPLFPEDEHFFFAHFNEDLIADGYYDGGDTLFIIDGDTGQKYSPLPIEMPNTPNAQVIPKDLNQDGLMDFIRQADNFPSSDTIVHEAYLNQGDYVFEKFSTRGFLVPENFGDFDGDGYLDLIAQYGFGEFRIKTNIISADSADFIYLDTPVDGSNSSLPYDLNEDGYDDLFIFTDDRVYFCKNNQDSSFQIYSQALWNKTSMHFVTHPSWPIGTLVGEYGTGTPVIYHFAFDDTTFSVKKSSATIQPPVINRKPYRHRMNSLDIDMDGQFELALGTENELNIAEYTGTHFNEYAALDLEFGEENLVGAMASADLNKDGILDLVYSASNPQGHIFLRYGQADSTFSAAQIIADNVRLVFNIQIADFDGNGYLDIIAGSNYTEQLMLYLNQNGTQFIDKEILAREIEHLNIIDPNGDGAPDLAISWNFGTKIFINDGLANFQDSAVLSGWAIQHNNPNTNLVPTTSALLYQIDSTGFNRSILCSGGIDVDISSRSSYCLDYNLDGLPDLLFSKRNNSFSGDPDTSYLALADTLTGMWDLHEFPHRYVQAVHDINGDGTEDVLWEIGPQLFVEIIDTAIWSKVTDTQPEPLRIFPNPSTNYIQLDLPASKAITSIQIWDTQGRLQSTIYNFDGKINVQALQSGIYFLIAQNGDNDIFGGRFVKK